MRRSGLCLVSVLCLLVFSTWLAGCGGGNPSTPPPPPANPQVTLQASPASIAPAQSTTLTWTSSNATSVSITPAVGTAPLPLNGSATVTPASTTTYTITATGASGSTPATATATVAVGSGAAPTVTLTATPTQINSGQQSLLAWTSTNATSVNIVPNVLPNELPTYPLNGSAPIIPLATTNYVITATGPGGTATATVTVNVTQVPPMLSLALAPPTILAGKPTTLSWSTVNAATLTIVDSAGHPVTVSSPQQGSCIINGPPPQCATPPTATTTYTATATSPAGLVTTAMATLTVSNLSVTLTANPTSVMRGQKSTLTYTSMNALSLSIDNGVGTVSPPNGTAMTPALNVTTNFTITATDANGITNTATATVAVNNGSGLQNLQHIVFFVQENRSFDTYFGKLGIYRANDPFTHQSYGSVSDIDGIADDTQFSNNDANGKPIHPFHQPSLCIDVLSPSWDESHVMTDLHNGVYKMDKFVTVGSHEGLPGGPINDPLGHRAMGYYDQRDLPYYYELATQYATSDRFFAPVLAPTIPNRMYLFAGTSYGTTYPQVPTPGAYQQKTIFQELSEHGVSWHYYYQDDSSFIYQYIAAGNGSLDYLEQSVRNISEYYDILAGRVPPSGDRTLAKVVFIERGSSSAKTDEHPDAGKNVQYGAAAAANIINAFLASSYYASSAFILTYDEAGGLYDHVMPQPAVAPDNQPPSLQSPDGGHTQVVPGDFLETSMRLPFILISPYVKPHYVSHTVRDETAILKLIEDRFGLPALTARDAAQPDMLEFFDFANPSLLTPPPLPTQPGPVHPNDNCHERQEAGPE